MVTSKRSGRGGGPALRRRRRLCVLSLIALAPARAFQFPSPPTTARRARRGREVAAGASPNEDPVAELFGAAGGESPAGATSEADATPAAPPGPAQFGESVPFVPPSRRGRGAAGDGGSDATPSAGVDALDVDEILKRNRTRNVAVAAISFAVALLNYGYQFLHPVTAIEILTTMERESAPLTAIGNNGKPTVIDFWAPWCENCKVAAPTLRAVEEEYGDRVNFVSVSADDGRNWPLVRLFGVDAIPHMAFLSGEGDVETALVGPVPRNVLRADLDALLATREGCERTDASQPICHEELPYTMFDAFENRQGGRRINFVEAMKSN